jgi:hypothetical protein
MSMRNFEPALQYIPEAERILRERFKFTAQETEEIISKVFWHFTGLPHGEEVKNPRRALLSAVRKIAAARRREEKTWATRGKNL